jgi:serine protease Do
MKSAGKCLSIWFAVIASSNCREKTMSIAPSSTQGPTEESLFAKLWPAATVQGGTVAAPPSPAYGRAVPDFAELVAQTKRSVVGIAAASTAVKQGPAAMYPAPISIYSGTGADGLASTALGTGFVVSIASTASSNIYVVTAEAIAKSADALVVIASDGVSSPARLIGVDPVLGIALLLVTDTDNADNESSLQPLTWANSDTSRVGDWVCAVGNPFGNDINAAIGVLASMGAPLWSGAPTATNQSTGTPAKNNSDSATLGHNQGFRGFFTTDIRLHRGNRGGPVLDTAGQVVGLALSPLGKAAELAVPQELSFVIPGSRIKEILPALRDRGSVQRSWLGAVVQPVTTQLLTRLTARVPDAGSPTVDAPPQIPAPTSGAFIADIRANSPASKAGLQVNDIVTMWDDRPVDHISMPYIVSAATAGKPVNVALWRAGAMITVSVVPALMP